MRFDTRDVYVTQEDIDHGVKADCNSCPVARALKREFPECECIVDQFEATVFLPGKMNQRPWITYEHDAGNFIRAFDSERELPDRRVFRFTLITANIPPTTDTEGAHH